MEPVAVYLAKNLSQLRTARGYTQAQLALEAGLPRSTLTNMESGSANPSLQNLLAVAGALKVSVEELLSKPRRELEHIAASEVPMQSRAGGKARVFKLLPDKIKGMNIDRMELDRGVRMPGHMHIKGTKEYLTVIEGEMTVYIQGTANVVREGDVLAFEGDQPHAYHASGGRSAKAISVVIPL
jgi:transcriptional regulator with XRE-family HTH domain